jgi:hypothetical protein
MQTEFVYKGHDNSINLILKADGAAVSLASVTRMTLSFAAKLIDSDNGDADPIRWVKAGYATGEARLFLGAETIKPGAYQAPLIVYDATNLNGVFWGNIPITVIADPEAEV